MGYAIDNSNSGTLEDIFPLTPFSNFPLLHTLTKLSAEELKSRIFPDDLDLDIRERGLRFGRKSQLTKYLVSAASWLVDLMLHPSRNPSIILFFQRHNLVVILRQV